MLEPYDKAMEGRDEHDSDLWLHSPHFEPGFEEELRGGVEPEDSANHAGG